MLDARFSHLYFCQSLYTLQRGLTAIAGRLGFKTCFSKTKTKTKTKTLRFQDQDQDQDFDVQDQDRNSRLTKPILEVHD